MEGRGRLRNSVTRLERAQEETDGKTKTTYKLEFLKVGIGRMGVFEN